ncbi:MAG TPA: peptidylprolyl isomerase [Phycisphaerales bacterium]|nr:peptidylprolyl isomerase [Phycisphaerales bacterium]
MPMHLAILLTALGIPYQPIQVPKPWTPTHGTIAVDVLRDIPEATLVLMTHNGTPLGDPIPATVGQFDALEAFPVICTLDEAAYLQMIGGKNVPIGASLVIEPALSRRVPIVEERNDDVRGTWTTIVGWQDEGTDDRDDLPAGAGHTEGAATPTSVPRDEAVVRSGWWIHSEVDVEMVTDHGTVRIDLREDAAPHTTRNFLLLASRHFYDDTIAHRIIPTGRNGRPFVVQGGDPTGTGSGGPGWWLPLEPSTLGHAFGVISMARANDPDSAGSQWFIALDRQECARLDGLYCAFGEAVDGRDAIVSMATTPLEDTDYFSSRPVTPPTITETRVLAAPPRTPGKGRPDRPLLPPTDGLWHATK